MPRIVNQVGDWYQFPLGIAYVSSSLKAGGFNIYTINLNHEKKSIQEIMQEYIMKYDIDIVSTGGLTGQYGAIREVLYWAKQINPEIVTIAGGGIVTSDPKNAMIAIEFADFGVIGEGELISQDLHKALEEKTNIDDVAGIIYKTDSDFKITEGKIKPIDLDVIPMPDYEGFELGRLLSSVPNVIGMSEHNTVSIITSRSCPFRCTFCFHPSGQKFRQRSLDNVFKEIDYLVKNYGAKFFSISDELFGYDIERVREFCRRIKPYNVGWLANFRVPDVTPELIEILKGGNCTTMAFGIESADNNILKSMNKKITVEQIERALKLVYDAGMAIQGVLIFGDPAETVESATKTLNWWKEHIHYELMLSLIITYPGTALYKYACENGIIKDPVQFIKDGCPVIRLSKMNNDEYVWLFEQVVGMPRITHKEPVNAVITNIDYDNANVNITGNCIKCGTLNKWEQSRLFIMESLTCINCGSRHIAPIPSSVVENINNGIEHLLDEHGKIVFWGVNSYFYSLSEKLNMNNDHIYYVDKSDVRIGVNVSGKRIQSPKIIEDENISCIIVSVPQYFTSIRKSIKDEYPQVEKIISISDLLSNKILIEK